jgi:ATP-dependent RNA helicase SUPV3L1/SUV3
MSAHPALSAVARRAAQRAAVRPPLPASPLLHLSAAPAAHESAAHAGPSRVSQQAARRQLHSSAFAASPLATPLRAVQLRHAVLSCEASSSASRAMHTSAACAFQSSSSRSRDSRSQRGGSSDRGARGGARGGGRGGRGGRAPGAYFARPSAAPAFGPTSKITPEKAAQEALDQITDMRKDTALRHMFVALGLRGEGPRALVADEAVTEDGDAEIVGLLIDRWAEEVQPLIRKALALHLEGDLEAQEGWSIAELQAAHTAEAEQGIARIANASLVQHLIAQLNALATSGQAEIAASARAVAQQLAEVTRLMDLRNPALDYPTARSLTRHIHLHVGPTNSGKTYGALVALCKARNGIYAGPLRLLAHEVWERINAGAVSADIAPRACSLLTGEERQLQLACGLTACTVEMLATNISYDIAVVDEIQMIADKDRGYAWTQAVLGLAAKELHLCGEASVVPLIRRMAEACGDVVHVHEYKRLTPLVVEEKTLGGIRNVRPGDCVVSFSRSGIFKLKEKIEEATGLKCALAYGALPPETKSEQAKMFNDPQSGVDVMVASDAIGMGLNLCVCRPSRPSLQS